MNTKLMKLAFALCATCIAALDASATTYTAIKNKSDWSDPASFTVNGEPATTVPGSADVIELPEAGTWSFTAGTPAFDVLANVYLVGVNKNFIQTYIEVTVPEGTVDINSMIAPTTKNGSGKYDGSAWRFCTLTKKGAGTLRLICDGSKYYDYGGSGYVRNFFTNMRVLEGTIRLMPDCPSSTCGIGFLEVAKGAKYYLPNKKDDPSSFCNQCNGLLGEGTVASDQTCSPLLDIFGQTIIMTEYGKDFTFSGAFVDESTGTMTIRCCGPQNFRGGQLANKGSFQQWTTGYYWESEEPNAYGVVTTDSLGLKGEPSSLGAGNEIAFLSLGGVLRYHGPGETTDKIYTFQQAGDPQLTKQMPIIFNAGPTGGVTFVSTTEWTDGGSSAHDPRVILSGDNRDPMRVLCPVKLRSGWTHPMYFLKRGTGTWTFENDTSTTCGSIEIDEGTIGTTSIDETGYVSALGKATRLHTFVDGYLTTAEMDATLGSPYAVTLAATSSVTRGTLDFIGAKGTGSISRKIALARFGGKIASDGQSTVLLNGITVRDANLATTLVLGGTNTHDNTLLNVTNGIGSIALVKEDSGKWILTDDIDIDSVEVKGGTLVLENPTGKSYTWFKFIVKEARNVNFTDNKFDAEHMVATSPQWPCIEEFVLQDAEGNRQNAELLEADTQYGGTPSVYYSTVDPVNCYGLGPGYYGYGARGTVRGGNWDSSKQKRHDRLAGNLFDNKVGTSGGYWLSCYNGSTTAPRLSNSSTWAAVVFRLPEGAPHIASCDLVACTGGGWANELSAWGLEGSRDGVHWESITNYDSKVTMSAVDPNMPDGFNMHRSGTEYWSLVDKYGRSQSSKTRWAAGQTKAPEANGYPFPGVVTNDTFKFPASLASVKVSGNGTLVIDSTTSVTLSNLTVDATTGGTISNGTYAATGTLKLENVGSDAAIAVPGSFKGLDTTGWTINLPQGAQNRIVTVEDGKIKIVKRGLVMIIR